MKQLLIAIAPRETRMYGAEALYCNADYTEYLCAADPDVLPVILPVCDKAKAERYAALCDGLLLAGGADLDPSFYDEENEGSVDMYARKYDESDINLYHAFTCLHKPVFGVCRGIQVINAAEGGNLVQDISSLNGVEHNQRRFRPAKGASETAHLVTCVPGTVMHEIFGKTADVNTYHHQAINEPADGFTVSAYSPDGIIEAIEKDRVIAVQWHPERLRDDEAQIALARYFIDQCRSAE